MAVFTKLDRHTLTAYLQSFNVGDLISFEGVTTGAENTNYFIKTNHDDHSKNIPHLSGEYVLTLTECLQIEELPFVIKLHQTLADQGLPVINPILDDHGNRVRMLAGKPALLFPRFSGQHPNPITSEHCSAIGSMLATFHCADIDLERPNYRDVKWLNHEINRLQHYISDADYTLMCNEIDLLNEFIHSKPDLPIGVIHGDLFHDNTLFVDHKIVGLIDLYDACTDFLLYDLAIVVNDWCVNADRGIDKKRFDALIGAYRSNRTFTNAECDAWSLLLRAAALRFWVSRLISMHLPNAVHSNSGGQHIKEPEEFKKILLDRIQHNYTII